MGNVYRLLGDGLLGADMLFESGGIREIERPLRDNQGHESVLLIDLRRVAIQDSTLLFVCQGITQRRDIEQRLREQERRYRHRVEMSPDSNAIHQRGKILFINEAGANHLGPSKPEEIAGKRFWDFIAPDGREAARSRIRSLPDAQTRSPLYEQRLRRLDGQQIDVEIIGVPITYQGEQAIQVMAHGITDSAARARMVIPALAFLVVPVVVWIDRRSRRHGDR